MSIKKNRGCSSAFNNSIEVAVVVKYAVVSALSPTAIALYIYIYIHIYICVCVYEYIKAISIKHAKRSYLEN